jgi:hypothetical protein
MNIARTQAQRLTEWLYDELPENTNMTEFECGLEMYFALFLSAVAERELRSYKLAQFVNRTARRIYDDEVWQVHHAPEDEYFLRLLIELALINLLGSPKPLRTLIRQWDSLRVTAVFEANQSLN